MSCCNFFARILVSGHALLFSHLLDGSILESVTPCVIERKDVRVGVSLNSEHGKRSRWRTAHRHPCREASIHQKGRTQASGFIKRALSKVCQLVLTVLTSSPALLASLEGSHRVLATRTKPSKSIAPLQRGSACRGVVPNPREGKPSGTQGLSVMRQVPSG